MRRFRLEAGPGTGRDTPMSAAVLADLVVLVHLLFVVFAVGGGLLVLRWPWLALAHLPAAAWAVLVELQGWICPLTPLENALRRRAGEAAYHQGFVEEYLVPVLYPAALTHRTQIILGAGVLLINLLVYAWVWRALRARHRDARSTSAASSSRDEVM